MKFNIADYFTQMQPANIVRVEAFRNYCKIYFKNNKNTLMISITLMRVQERLPAEMFVRVHRSHLVNTLYVKQVNMGEAKIVELTNGELITVSRRKHSIIKIINKQKASVN